MAGARPMPTHAFLCYTTVRRLWRRPTRSRATKDFRLNCAAHRQIGYCMCTKASPDSLRGGGGRPLSCSPAPAVVGDRASRRGVRRPASPADAALPVRVQRRSCAEIAVLRMPTGRAPGSLNAHLARQALGLAISARGEAVAGTGRRDGRSRLGSGQGGPDVRGGRHRPAAWRATHACPTRRVRLRGRRRHRRDHQPDRDSAVGVGRRRRGRPCHPPGRAPPSSARPAAQPDRPHH